MKIKAAQLRIAAYASRSSSGDDVVCDVAIYVGESKVTAGVVPGQMRMVQTEQVQDRGVQVVQCHAILDGVVSELVGGTVTDAAFHTAACHPDSEAVCVVVAPDILTTAGL